MPGGSVSRTKRPRLRGSAGFPGFWPAVLIIAGTAARFWRLGARSWSFDEALGLFPAAQPDLASVIASPPWVAFPFFHAVLHYWTLLGSQEAWVRALPALLSSVSLVPAWGILKRLFPPSVALGALALFAFSPFQVLLAQDARPYGIVICAQLWAFLLLLSSLDRPAWWKWALWSALLAVASLAHVVAALWIPATILFLVLFKKGRKLIAGSLAWGAGALLVFLLEALWMRGAIAHVNAATQFTDPVTLAYGLLQLYGVSPYVPSGLYVPGMVLFGGLAVFGAWRLLSSSKKGGLEMPGAALAACGLFPLAAILLANWAGELYMPKLRYAAVSQLPLLAACVAGVFALRGRVVRAGLMSLLLLVSVSSLFLYFQGGTPTLDLPPYRKPLRAVAELITSRARPGDSVVSLNLLTYLPLKLYLKDSLPQCYVIRDPLFMDSELEKLGRPQPVKRLLGRGGRIWLVIAPVLYSSAPAVPLEIARALKVGANKAESFELPGVAIDLWVVKSDGGAAERVEAP